jgi:putative addiction module component (TIGR02574 family)
LCSIDHGEDDEEICMTSAAEQVLEGALKLPPVDRAELIERLFLSFDSSADRQVDVAWSAEVESRIDAYDDGKIVASPAEEVFARINAK